MSTVRVTVIAALAATAMALAACGSTSSPLPGATDSSAAESDAASDGTSAGTPSTAQPAETQPAETQPSATGEPAAPLVIGSGNFTESELIAGIYAAALAARGIAATTHLDIGSREVYLQALEEGSVTVFPEYTGGLLAYYDPASKAHSPDDVYADLTAALPQDLTVLDYSAAQDQDSVTVTRKTAQQYGLTSIGDLAPVAGKMTLGGSSEWQTRADGPEGFKKVYGVEFGSYKVLDPGGPLSVKGLVTGLVDATDIFTTDPAIKANDFVVLDDPEHLFLAQNVVPLVAKAAATPEVTAALNAVSAKLTTASLTEMLAKISATKADPADIAQQWVAANGLG